MRKITSFYYLNYPDKMPEDPHNACSELYVEVGGQDSSINNFDQTYSFQVYTIGYLNDLIGSKNGFLVDRSVIIVEKFDDKLIEQALESIIFDIENFGTIK